MSDHVAIEDLHLRLESERRRVVQAAAASDALPARNLLAYLSDLAGAIDAVEAVIEEGGSAHRATGERPRLHA